MLKDNRPQDKKTLAEYLRQALEKFKDRPRPRLRILGIEKCWE